jgi:hypothetical protein
MERREPDARQLRVYTGQTLQGIVVFKHDVYGIVERNDVFGFVVIKTERLRACAEELAEKVFLYLRAHIVLTNCKLVLLNTVQDVFVRAAGELRLGVLRAKTETHCHCQFDGIRAALLMLHSAKMTLPAV